MAYDIAGSNGTLEIDGISFDVAADANFSVIPTQYENDLVATSGKPMIKKMRRTANVESVVLIANADDREKLKAFNDQKEAYGIAWTNAAGDIYRTTGVIHFESYETEESRCTITLLPREEWAPFIA